MRMKEIEQVRYDIDDDDADDILTLGGVICLLAEVAIDDDDDDGFLLYLWTSCRFPTLCMSVIKKTPQSFGSDRLPQRRCCCRPCFLFLFYYEWVTKTKVIF